MPGCPLLEIKSISLCVEPGDIVVATSASGPATSWRGINNERMRLNGDDITEWDASVRLRAGLFITSGRPAPVPAVRTIDIVHRMQPGSPGGAAERRTAAAMWCEKLGRTPDLLERRLDEAFSPGDAMVIELLQLAMLRPQVAVIDLTDHVVDGSVASALTSGIGHIKDDQPEIAVVVVANAGNLEAALAPDHLPTHAVTEFALDQADRDETLL